MPTQVLIFMIIGLAIGVINSITNLSKNEKMKKIIRMSFDITLIISSILSSLHSLSGIFGEIVGLITLIMTGLFVYSVLDIFLIFLKSKINEKIRPFISIAPSIILYVLAIIGEFIYFGFNFVELIIFSAAAIVFYVSIYILKREENTKTIILFFGYVVLVSYFLGKTMSGMLLSNAVDIEKEMVIPMFIGALFIYLSNIVIDSDSIFSFKREKYARAFSIISTLILNVGLIVLSISMSFAF